MNTFMDLVFLIRFSWFNEFLIKISFTIFQLQLNKRFSYSEFSMQNFYVNAV